MKYETGQGVEDSRVAGFALAELRKHLAMAEIDGQAPDVIALSLLPPCEFPQPFHDGFRLVRSGDKLSILAGQDRGLLNGVYEILGRLGFSFPFPGMDRSPRKADWASLKKCAGEGQCCVPSFRHRILHFDNMRLSPAMIDWAGKLKINMIQRPLHEYKIDTATAPELVDRIGERGIELSVGCHGFDNWLPPSQYGREHPEWYAEEHPVHRGVFIDPTGELPPVEFSAGQICLSNPEVLKAFSGNVISFLNANPQVRTISLWPNDGIDNWCSCENCLALEPDPDRLDPQTGTPSRTTSYLWFIRHVSELVHAQVPDARIDFAAFYDFATPPQNVEVIPQGDRYLGFLVDDYFGCLLHGHGERFNRDRIESSHRKWREVFPNEIYAVGYYSGLHKIMDFPIVFTTKIREDFDYLKEEIGVDSVMTLVCCAELDYLQDHCFQNIYSFAALGWDHRRPSEDILRQLAAAISPSSCGDVFDYWNILDRLGRDHPDTHPGWIWMRRDKSQFANWGHMATQVAVGELISQDRLTAMQDGLNRALAGAGADPIAVDILGRMQRVCRTLELMLSYDPEAPVDRQMAVLDQIARAVSKRGKFPSCVVPALAALREQAQQDPPGGDAPSIRRP